MILAAIGIMVFLAAAFLVMGFVMETQSRRMSGRFTALAAASVVEEEDDTPEILKRSLHERFLAPLLARAAGFAGRLTPAASLKALNLQLDRAGRPWGLNAHTWVLARALSAAAGLVGAALALRSLPLDGPLLVCAVAGIAAAGMILPGVMLDSKTRQRQLAVKQALPDVMDLLVVSVEAGMGLDGAVQEVVNRRKGPLLEELARVLAEVRVGKTRRAAWQQLSERVDLLELRVFVAALIQAEELGASVAGVLRSQSEALRVRRSLSVREVAAMLPVKMLFPLIFFIFPSIFVVILGPGMISLVESFREIGF